MLCKHPEEVCCNMTFYHGKIYCDNRNEFCHLHDDPTECMDVDSSFTEGVLQYDMEDPLEILNWYRNLYYHETGNTERSIMARAINDLFMTYKEMFAGNDTEE